MLGHDVTICETGSKTTSEQDAGRDLLMNEAQLHNLVHDWIAQARQGEGTRPLGQSSANPSVERVTVFMDTVLRLFTWADGASPDLRVEHRPEGPEDNLSHYLRWEATNPHRYLAISADQVSGQCWYSWGTPMGEAVPWRELDLGSRSPVTDEDWVIDHLARLADDRLWQSGHVPPAELARTAA
jgi:hypothetical protein